MYNREPWTEKDVSILKERFRDNVPVSEIAKELGRTNSTICYQLRKRGLTREKLKATRQLTDVQKTYIKEHYKSEAIGTMARAVGLPWETVRARMVDMGLPVQIEDNRWSAADMNRLRSLAAAGKTVEEIASALGRTENGVSLKARKSGIVIYQDGRKWTVEELDYLRRNWGYVNVSTIAKHVHRSVDATCQQAHKMHLGPVYSLSEDIALGEFCRNTGISRDRIMGTLMPKHGFPLLSRKYGKRQYYYFVDMDEILGWLEGHQGLFDASRFQDGFFVEPEWLRRKKRTDREDNSYLPPDVTKEWWTQQEIDHVKLLMDMGYDYGQVADKISRSARAIKRKMYLEGATWRLKAFWKGREFKYLREHWQTQTDEEIGEYLGRTAAAVEAQRRSLGYYRQGSLREDEMEYVRANWTEKSDEEMSEHVGKSVIAVVNARYRMGLYRPELKEWSPDDVEYLTEHWEEQSDAEIALHVGKSKYSVEKKRKSLGLYRKSMEQEEDAV